MSTKNGRMLGYITALAIVLLLIIISGCVEERAPPTSTIDPVSKVVEDELSRLSPGQILYNPPQEMTVGEKERVEVRITKNFTKNLSEGLRGRGEPQTANISVDTFMKVRLTGYNYYIESLSPEDQPVSSERATQWDFDVTPLESGNQALRLSVTVRIKMPNEPEEQMDVNVFERQIQVKVNPIEDMVNNLTLEQIILNAPQEMTVDVTERAGVRVPKNLIENLSKGNREMVVNLTGQNFDIEEQNVASGEDSTEWIYSITPLKSGNQSLKLDIGTILKFPNGEDRKYDKVLDKTINVKANVTKQFQDFIENNWQWIIGTLIIGSGFIGWLARKLRKQKEE